MQKLISILVGALALALAPVASAQWLTVLGKSAVPSILSANVTSSAATSSGATITQAVDCTGANALVVFFFGNPLTVFSSVSATYNGVAMTEPSPLPYDPVGGGALYLGYFRLVAPASGSHNVVITFVGSTLIESAIVCVPMFGVNQSTPEGTPVGAANLVGSGTASATITSAANQLAFGFVWVGNNVTLTPGTGQTTLANLTTGSSNKVMLTSQAGATSVSPSFTFTSNIWAEIAVGVKP